MDQYELNGSIKWDAYMNTCEAYLDCGLPNFIEEKLNLTSFPAFVCESVQDYGKAWPLKPHSDVIDEYFESNKMRVIASFQDLYVGLEPYRNNNNNQTNNLFGKITGGVWTSTAPAVFGLLSAIELHPTNTKCGVYAPVGGFQAVTDSLIKLATDLNVTMQCETTVTRITNKGVYCCKTSTIESNSSTTTADNNEFVPADLIIVNADLPYATQVLLENTRDDKIKNDDDGDELIERSNKAFKSHPSPIARYDWDDKYRFSSGVIAFHWSLSQSLEELNTHNVFMIANSRQESEKSWDIMRKSQTKHASSSPSSSSSSSLFDGPFNFYVHRASKTDPTAAPPGMDSLLVLVPCQTLRRDHKLASLPRNEAFQRYKQQQFTDEFISNVRNAVIKRMSTAVPDIEKFILHEVIDTPITFANQYNVGAGTPFGLSHGFGQLSLTRPTGRSAKNENVLFCGASTRPGNGVPLVLIGAKLVAQAAMEQIIHTINKQ